MMNMLRFCRVLAFSAASLFAMACGRTARIDAVISDAPSSDIVVKMLNVNTFDVLDTRFSWTRGRLSSFICITVGKGLFPFF